MFVVLNPHFFHPFLLDNLYPESKFIQPEVSTKWMFVSPYSENANYVYVNDDRYNVCIVLFGRIHNINELKQWSNSPFSTEIETVIHLYLKYGIEQTARRLEGDYTMMLLDYNINHPCSVFYVLQNHLGTRPLYYGVLPNASASTLNVSSLFQHTAIYDTFVFSEHAYYLETIREKCSNLTIQSVPCGTYMEYHLAFGASPKWKYHSQHTYYTLPISPYLGKQIDETVSERDLQTLRLLYDTLYSWMERWLREQYDRKRPFVLLDTGDAESKLIIAISKRICSTEWCDEPSIYRVSLLSPNGSSLLSEPNTVAISPEALKEIVDNRCKLDETETAETMRKWISPYLVSQQLAKENGFVGNMLCSSCLEMTQWENGKYEDLLEMETALFNQLRIILPKYVQKINTVSTFGDCSIECVAPLFQRSCIDVLFRISAETRFMWAEKGVCWIQILLSMVSENMTFSPDEEQLKWEQWWNEYEQEQEKHRQRRLGKNHQNKWKDC